MADIDDDIDTIPMYCGFDQEANREIARDRFETFHDIMALTEKDISDLSKGFAERTAATGRIRPTLAKKDT
jgi:hypothetical protein